jgi:excisionase family DNA binding protein
VSTAVVERLLLRIPEAAETLGISRAKTYELIGRGDLKVLRIDGSVRVQMDELRR